MNYDSILPEHDYQHPHPLSDTILTQDDYEGPQGLLVSKIPSKVKKVALQAAILRYLGYPDNEIPSSEKALVQVRIVKLRQENLINEGYAYVYCHLLSHKKILLQSNDFLLKKRVMKFIEPISLKKLLSNIIKYKSLQLHVRKLKEKTTEEDLENYFKNFGKIASIEIARNSRNRRSLGYATIRFSSLSSVKRVLAVDKHEILQKTVLCQAFMLKSESYQEEKKEKPMKSSELGIPLSHSQISHKSPIFTQSDRKDCKLELAPQNALQRDLTPALNESNEDFTNFNKIENSSKFENFHSKSKYKGISVVTIGNGLKENSNFEMHDAGRKLNMEEKTSNLFEKKIQGDQPYIASFTDCNEPNYRFNWQNW